MLRNFQHLFKKHRPDDPKPVPLEDNLGVFFTCYTEVDAVKYALAELYKIYPSIRCLIISDGGADFSFLEATHPTCKAILGDDTRGCIFGNSPATFTHPDQQTRILRSMYVFLDRIAQAIDYCKTEYILIMEPDVLVRGKLSVPQGAKVTGSLINELDFPELHSELRSHPRGVAVTRYGATPTIIESAAFMQVRDYFLKRPGAVRRLSAACHIMASYDVLLPVAFALLGHREVFNPEIVECLRDPDWERSGKPLVHQYRYRYPKAQSGYTGKHAAEMLRNWPAELAPGEM